MFYFIIGFSYYEMPVEEVRKFIDALDHNKTDVSIHPYISDKLRKLVESVSKPKQLEDIKEEIKDELNQIKVEFQKRPEDIIDKMKDELGQMKDELKQQIRDELKQQIRDELKQQIRD